MIITWNKNEKDKKLSYGLNQSHHSLQGQNTSKSDHSNSSPKRGINEDDIKINEKIINDVENTLNLEETFSNSDKYQSNFSFMSNYEHDSGFYNFVISNNNNNNNNNNNINLDLNTNINLQNDQSSSKNKNNRQFSQNEMFIINNFNLFLQTNQDNKELQKNNEASENIINCIISNNKNENILKFIYESIDFNFFKLICNYFNDNGYKILKHCLENICLNKNLFSPKIKLINNILNYCNYFIRNKVGTDILIALIRTKNVSYINIIFKCIQQNFVYYSCQENSSQLILELYNLKSNYVSFQLNQYVKQYYLPLSNNIYGSSIIKKVIELSNICPISYYAPNINKNNC